MSERQPDKKRGYISFGMMVIIGLILGILIRRVTLGLVIGLVIGLLATSTIKRR